MVGDVTVCEQLVTHDVMNTLAPTLLSVSLISAKHTYLSALVATAKYRICVLLRLAS